MKEEIKVLMQKYKMKIGILQHSRNHQEILGKGGKCIMMTAEIQTLNAVICDLKRILKLF